MRPTLALLSALLIALAGCSSGNACPDRGGTCHPNGICPNGTQPPTSAQLAASVNSEPYLCPTLLDGGGSVVCCLPIPVTD